MGAGGKAINIFKFNKGDDPDQVINWRLWFVCEPQENFRTSLVSLLCSSTSDFNLTDSRIGRL
jgi:hypothetical protein